MENIVHIFSSLLDVLFYGVISPIGTMLARVLELVLLKPLQLAHIPPALHIVLVAVLTAFLSLMLRKILKADEKEAEFRKVFLAKKSQQEELHLISDWKSREKLAKAMDDDIDEDFNSYLAGRFARYGIAYLLPLFLSLYWLQSVTGYAAVLTLPSEVLGISGVPTLVVFLLAYGTTIFLRFRHRKKKMAKTVISPSV